MDSKSQITDYLSGKIAEIFLKQSDKFWDNLQEIRIRINKPLIVIESGNEFFLDTVGRKCGVLSAYLPSREDIEKCIALISDYSLYAFEEELRNGYITIAGGHRVGISGRAVLSNGGIKTLKNINGLNFRISHEIKGCSDKVMKYIVGANNGIKNTMIVSPPCCGKTTLLRDIVRTLSNSGFAVSVVDERSEIAGCYMGVPQNDIGVRTDVLDSCPKALGILMLLRSMSPKVIAVDEIGKVEDVQAIDEALCAGVKFVCTVHSTDIEELKQKSQISDLIRKKTIERYVVLKNFGELGGVYDADLKYIGGGAV